MGAAFRFDPQRSAAVIARMRRAPTGRIGIEGEHWAQAAMGALVNAELLAAQAGVVPWMQLPNGETGIVRVGAAREYIEHAPEGVRTLYLGTHALVRSTHARATVADPGDFMLGDVDDALGEPITIGTFALIALGVAAIVAAAWYFVSREKIQVEGRNLRTTALLSDASNLALEQLKQTGKIDPGLWETFKEVAKTEVDAPWIPFAIAGGVLAGGLGTLLAWRHFHGKGAAS